jgi:hypothetical protein
MIDWTFLVGIGTIILALATLALVVQSRRQVHALLHQLNIQIGQQIPYVYF